VSVHFSSSRCSLRSQTILIIWGDDIGWFNISAYNLGVMGYKTPNIDRSAREGAIFTDWYGQQSCTAPSGRLQCDGCSGWEIARSSPRVLLFQR
jgi:hypothetical protein